MSKSLEQLEELDIKAQPGAFSTFDMEPFIEEMEKLSEGDIYLEIGVDKGKSLSIAKMVKNPKVEIKAVDINFTNKLKEYLKDNTDIEFFWMSSKTASIMWKETQRPKIKLVFIDGDHSYEGCKIDIDSWFPHLTDNAVLLFHDCDETSPGVLQAISEFINQMPKRIGEFKLFKRTDRNTSMAKIQLI